MAIHWRRRFASLALVVGAHSAYASDMPELDAIDAAATRAWDGDFQLAGCDDPCACDDPRDCGVGCGDAVGCGSNIACGSGVAAPAFGGPCWSRTKLTGDWGGARTGLAASGVTLDADNTSFFFGNTRGGLRRGFEYGGHGDYVLNLDMGKLAGVPGQFWKIRAEHSFGDSVNGDTGAIIPATVLTDVPVRGSEHVYITNFLLTQALSKEFALFAGKLDTLDGDTTAYASGRGKTQFSNMAMVADLAPLVMFPYSSLGAGFVIMRDLQPIYTFTVINSTDTTRTSGFDELFNDGATLISFLRLPTGFFGKPGHQGFGASWSSKNFVSLGQDPRVILPDVPIARQSDSWSLFWNCDQALVVDPANPQRHWGFFGRAGIADEQTSVIRYFLSAGVGGASPHASRPGDTWGVGWYHVGLSDEIGPLLVQALGPLRDGDGIELFYNAEVTPWCHVTPDFQVIVPSRENVNAALVAGVRANIDF